MEKNSALEKRIKRQVTAREHRFFVVVAPGLGTVCRTELDRLFDGRKALTEVDGGIEFDGQVADCYLANLHLRCASRIIMRLGAFSATDFPALETKAGGLPWELYLNGTGGLDIHVTLRKSKLYHSGAVEQRFREAILRRLGPGEAGHPGPVIRQTVFVRAFQDRFEVSLDSSGDLLYMRGLKTRGGKAPLRETLAAGMLMLAGYDGTRPLIDPMCGSGSFSLEAAMMARNIPPGWYRHFAFEHWPCFRPGIFRHIRREAEATIRSDNGAMILASDRDNEACDQLTEQAEQAGMGHLIQVTCRDLFDCDPERLGLEAGLVLVNPPYGLRLGTKKESDNLIRELFDWFGKKYKGWTVGLISPLGVRELKPSFAVTSYPLFHGGLNLFFLTGRVGADQRKRLVSR